MSSLAKLMVAPSKAEVPQVLTTAIVNLFEQKQNQQHQTSVPFTIALSGGSLPSLLSTLPQAFQGKNVDPCWEKWHVLLADERCVPNDHEDSNLGAIQTKLLSKIGIPANQVHGINQSLLSSSENSTEAIASDYENVLQATLAHTGGMLDLAVLGFGPDGHTCSLFPGHELLQESTKSVAPITNSPKPPPNRITLTFPVLNHKTRHVIFCGAGSSKQPIIQAIFSQGGVKKVDDHTYDARLVSPPPYPCAMVTPTVSLTWIVDADAVPEPLLNPATKQKTGEVWAKVFVAPTKARVPDTLNPLIVQQSMQALAKRDRFTIALSGGSLPKFLGSLPDSFAKLGVDPCWGKWHVLLADERCVPCNHEDSNLGEIRTHMLSKIGIPANQIYGIDESLLSEKNSNSTNDVADAYQAILQTVLQGNNFLDVAVLGFGPDGHTCSLFPGHELLKESTKWVAPITDSPKPPPNRITLTLPFLNQHTRTVIFCGAGSSKSPILRDVFSSSKGVKMGNDGHVSIQTNPPPYPCAMVHPLEDLIWVVDADAMPQEPIRQQCAL